MTTLHTDLHQRTWRELRAITFAHGLPFDVRLTKHQARARLHHTLTAGGQLRRSFRTLQPPERAALVALQAAGGSLPLYRFEAAFGPIRPFRPWREDAPLHPWRRPVSPAERLWFLGFIAVEPGARGRPRRVHAPEDVLTLLPPLPRPRPSRRKLPRPSYSPGVLLADLAALIGTLAGLRVKPRWHRWLPPYALKAINARLRAPANLTGIRSELQTGRLRFIHYLAEVSRLVAIQDGMILPTPAAWAWLDLPPDHQWRWLWDAWTRDLSARDPLWNVYRLPPCPAPLWGALVACLRDLSPRHTYSFTTLAAALRPAVLDEPALGTLPDLLSGPFAWAGMISVGRGRFAPSPEGIAALRGIPGAFAEPGVAKFHLEHDALLILLPANPCLGPFARLCAWASVDERGFAVDAAAVRRAIEGGFAWLDLVGMLTDLAGEPLQRQVYHRLEEWARAARQLTLQHMTVLTAPDPALLARLRQDRRLRPFFAEPLSAHHAAVRPHAADALRQHLTRRGLSVTARLDPPRASPNPGGPLTDLAPYLWLAAHTYRRLGAWVKLPVHLPGAVPDRLAAHLPPESRDDLEHAARTLLADLARTVAGHIARPPPVAQDDPAGIRAAVERAYTARLPLTIEYLSPADGAPTVRRVTPVLPIAESGGAAYVEAWCETAQAARTFRLDRILRIVND